MFEVLHWFTIYLWELSSILYYFQDINFQIFTPISSYVIKKKVAELFSFATFQDFYKIYYSYFKSNHAGDFDNVDFYLHSLYQEVNVSNYLSFIVLGFLLEWNIPRIYPILSFFTKKIFLVSLFYILVFNIFPILIFFMIE